MHFLDILYVFGCGCLHKRKTRSNESHAANYNSDLELGLVAHAEHDASRYSRASTLPVEGYVTASSSLMTMNDFREVDIADMSEYTHSVTTYEQTQYGPSKTPTTSSIIPRSRPQVPHFTSNPFVTDDDHLLQSTLNRKKNPAASYSQESLPRKTTRSNALSTDVAAENTKLPTSDTRVPSITVTGPTGDARDMLPSQTRGSAAANKSLSHCTLQRTHSVRSSTSRSTRSSSSIKRKPVAGLSPLSQQ